MFAITDISIRNVLGKFKGIFYTCTTEFILHLAYNPILTTKEQHYTENEKFINTSTQF